MELNQKSHGIFWWSKVSVMFGFSFTESGYSKGQLIFQLRGVLSQIFGHGLYFSLENLSGRTPATELLKRYLISSWILLFTGESKWAHTCDRIVRMLKRHFTTCWIVINIFMTIKIFFQSDFLHITSFFKGKLTKLRFIAALLFICPERILITLRCFSLRKINVKTRDFVFF